MVDLISILCLVINKISNFCLEATMLAGDAGTLIGTDDLWANQQAQSRC